MTGFLVGRSVNLPLWVDFVSFTPFFILGAAWIFLAATLVFRGDNVDKPNRMAQFYGYSVCLIAIIVALVTVATIISTTFDRAHPLESSSVFGESLSSFDAYKANRALRNEMEARAGIVRTDTVPDAALRVQYNGLVQDRTAQVRYDSEKTLVTSAFMLLAAIILFGLHWRWLRRMNGAAPA